MNLIVRGFDVEPDYLSENSPRNERISFLSLQTKPVCNAKCLYCFSGPELGKVPEDSLTLGEYKGIITQAKTLGAKTVVFSGVGEPTLDNNLPELVRFVHETGLTPIIYTNALFRKDLVKFFYDNGVSLMIKIDTLDPRVYRELIADFYDKFREILDLILKTYKSEQNDSEITRLGADTVVTNLNKDNLEEICNFCRGHKIKHFVSSLTKIGWARDNWELLVGENVEGLNNLVSKYFTGVSSQTLDNRCGLFAYGITIDVNGDLIGCSSGRWLRLGNARRQSLDRLIKIYKERIWNDKPNYCLARELSLGRS